jgi:hypothetical protein
MAKLAGDHAQILVGGYELTGDSYRIAINDARDTYDVATFGDSVRSFIGGQRAANIEHTGYLNAAAARSHLVLKGLAVDGVVSVLLGQNAAPAVGDPVYSLRALQGRYASTPSAGTYVPFVARFANKGELGGWGVLLTPPVNITNTTNGTAVDNGASSADGGAAFLHLLTAAATDRYTIVVEGSATGAFGGEQTTLATFTLDASALGSERVAIAGSIPQYVRYKATRTSGSAGDTVQLAVGLVRF